MASDEPSVIIKAPPTAGQLAASGGGPKDKDDISDPDLGEQGLLSSTPSSVQNQGPHFAPLKNLMTIIDTLRIENAQLRNHLSDQNLVIEHKSRNLEQINENYRQYDEIVKTKHRETAEKFRVMREQYEKLKEELKQLKEEQRTGQQEVKEREMGSWTALQMKQQQQRKHDTELDELRLALAEEKQMNLELSENLQKERDERKRDNQELRRNLEGELNGYKQQVQSLLTDLTESKRNLTNHSKKIQELHNANLQFDQVNSAYHEKLAIYEEELKKRVKDMDKLKQDYMTCNQQLKQYMQRLQTEKQDKQVFEEEVRKLQEYLRQEKFQVQEKEARIVSMEESLDLRDRKLKEHQERNEILNVQLKQYQEDFEHERLAREHSHHEARDNKQELQNLRRKNSELQSMVDQYTQQRMQDLGRQYSTSTHSLVDPVSPSSPHLPYGGNQRGYEWSEQHRMDHWAQVEQQVEPERHSCPLCPQEFAESRSLQIHVQTHFTETDAA